MTLEKAIEIITELQRQYLYTFNQDPIDALGLGIEALNAVKYVRTNNYFTPIDTLPGETED